MHKRCGPHGHIEDDDPGSSIDALHRLSFQSVAAQVFVFERRGESIPGGVWAVLQGADEVDPGETSREHGSILSGIASADQVDPVAVQYPKGRHLAL